MRTMSLYPLLGTLVAALLIGACGRTAPAPAAQATPAPTPNIEATVVAEVQARLRSATALTPTPVALPSAAREDVMAFATSRGQLVHDWDQLHVGFDTWRDGLIDCDVRSVEATLREFASTIGGLALQAGALPRSASVRELADKLVAGTEGEAEAVRQLRDGWQPEDPTTFENVERARSTALALQREMQDSLSDLQERTSPSSRAHVQTYSVSFAVLSGQWDEFRSNYDSFRTREPSLSSFEVVANLGQLVDEFRSIVVAVRDLPTDDVTRDVSTFLAQAAEAEDLALRKLRGSFQLTEGVSGGEAQAPPPDGEPGTPDPDGTSGASSGPVFTPSDPGLFDAFDAHLAESNALQRRAAQELADIVEETTSEAKAAVDEFARQYGLLLARWDRFHGDYDEWRRTEGWM